MKTINRYLWLPVTLIALMFTSSGVFADAGNYTSNINLKPVLALIEVEKYEAAINELHDMLDSDPDNSDVMALLGFTYRKTGNFEDALTFYQWALRSAPEHIGANEYLGELYLETNQFEKAVQQLEILDGICRSGCEEYTKLKDAIDTYEESS